MARLGDYIPARREAAAEQDTFRYCGEDLELRDSLNGYVTLDFAALVGLGESVTDPTVLCRIDDVIKNSFTPKAYKRFRELTIEWGVDVEGLVNVAGMLFAASTGRPTKRQSASPDGSAATTTSSSDTFSQLSTELTSEDS